MAWARVWEGGVVLCLCCESGFSVLVAGPGICIFNPYQYLLSNLYLSVADIANQICMAGWPKNGNRATFAGGGRGRHNLARVCQTAVTDPPRVVWSHL